MAEYPQPILVKLTVEQMKWSILHAFTAYESQVEEILNKELDRAISEFNFQAEAVQAIKQVVAQRVREIANRAINNRIGDIRLKVDELILDTLKLEETEEETEEDV